MVQAPLGGVDVTGLTREPPRAQVVLKGDEVSDAKVRDAARALGVMPLADGRVVGVAYGTNRGEAFDLMEIIVATVARIV